MKLIQKIKSQKQRIRTYQTLTNKILNQDELTTKEFNELRDLKELYETNDNLINYLYNELNKTYIQRGFGCFALMLLSIPVNPISSAIIMGGSLVGASTYVVKNHKLEKKRNELLKNESLEYLFQREPNT